MTHYGAMVLVLTGYLLGSPAISPVRPSIIDEPFVSFHKEMNRTIAVIGVHLRVMEYGMRSATPDIASGLRQP